jgi:hypothetical protein
MLVAIAAARPAMAQSAWLEPPPELGASHYVEFRVAQNSAYGHSYVVYGRLNARGKPISALYADLHPTGSLPVLVLGHVVPVDASTEPNRATRRQRIANRYRRDLTEAEYQQLTAVIERTRAERRSWSIISYNCNDFVAEVARGIGLRTPNALALPYDFITELKAMNEPAPAVAAATAEREPPPPPPAASTPAPAPATVPLPVPAPAARTASASSSSQTSMLPSIRPFLRKITSTRPVPPASIPGASQAALAP